MRPSTLSEKKDPWFRNHLIRNAIGCAIYDAMKLDPAIYLFGEGAHMKVHFDAPRIEQEFLHRVHTLPISEDSNTNFAVGASLVGVKPIVDVITADFLYRTIDSVCNTAAKINFVSARDETPKTIVIRAEFLLGGPTTGQRPEALFTHIPGLNVALPSTPKDAYGLMRTALASPGVTIFFEDRMIKDSETRPEDDFYLKSVPLGSAAVRRFVENAALTIVTYGLMRQVVEGVLDKHGIDKVELIDLRTLYPLDWDTIFDSVRRTGKILIVEPDVMYGGIGAEIAARVGEMGLSKLLQQASAIRLPPKIVRLGAPRSTIPASPYLHDRMLPTEEEIVAVIRKMEG